MKCCYVIVFGEAVRRIAILATFHFVVLIAANQASSPGACDARWREILRRLEDGIATGTEQISAISVHSSLLSRALLDLQPPQNRCARFASKS